MADAETRRRVQRLGWSAALRLASSGVQAWGGVSGGEAALVVEAGEEFTDGLTFSAVAVEAATARRGLTRRARRAAAFFALAAALMATIGTITEIIHDRGEWLSPLGGFSLADHEILAASLALILSAIVFALNFSARNSGRVSDKFAYRDSLRDFVIPGAVLILAVFRAPHLGEYIFETAGVAYGWYNTVQLLKGWNIRALLKPSEAK